MNGRQGSIQDDTHFDADFFRETLIELSKKALSLGIVEKADKEFPGKNASCGDSVVWQVEFSKDGSEIVGLQWQGVGCVISRASANAVVLLVKEKASVKDILSWGEKEIMNVLGLHEISPGREKCLLLGLSTLQKGLSNDS